MLAVVDRIVVIAVIAIGMTMVIITGGIDLSVGSLIAFAAVISTLVMKMMGGIHAGWHVVLVGFIVGIVVYKSDGYNRRLDSSQIQSRTPLLPLWR